MSARTYAIADLHGRFDLLERAVAAIEDDAPGGGTFIVLGDFVDRGPQSRQIVERLMAGPQRPGWRWIVLQGNHEDIMLHGLREPARHLGWWIGNGGGATLCSYGFTDGDDVPATHLAWLDGLPITHEDDHRIFVHAGVPFERSVGDTDQQTLQWMLYRGDGEHYADAQYEDDRPHVSGKHIVHGHHQSETHPLLKPHRTNLDSFAWFSGRLAIGVFDDAIPGGPTRVISVIGEPR